MNERDLAATLDFLERHQLASGLIPWAQGGQADAWNHTEALLALIVGGRREAAARGLGWVASVVAGDGAVCHLWSSSGVREPRIDLNCCLYPSVGLMAYLVAFRELGRVREWLGAFDATVELVLAHQRPDGSFPWALEPDRTPKPGSLLAASSAMVISLEAILVLDELLARSRPRVKEALEALRASFGLAEFLPRSEWAMDHYYPVLAGVSSAPHAALDRLLEEFWIQDEGLQAIAGSRWVTVAESSEAALALMRSGRSEEARALLAAVSRLRQPSGGYLTGWVLPDRVSFPAAEESTYSAAAFVLADRLVSADRPMSLIEGLLTLEPGD